MQLGKNQGKKLRSGPERVQAHSLDGDEPCRQLMRATGDGEVAHIRWHTKGTPGSKGLS